MEKDLRSYLKVYNNWFDADICDKTISELKNNSWRQNTFYDSVNKQYETYSGNNELDISWDGVSTDQYLVDRIWSGYQLYLQQLNFNWFNAWSGFSVIKFNRYNEDKLMAEHCDHIQSLFDGKQKGVPILTALGILNDDYVGGEFVMFEDEMIELKKGDLVIFPSNFLFPHRVEPVKSGTRYSFVTWAW